MAVHKPPDSKTDLKYRKAGFPQLEGMQERFFCAAGVLNVRSSVQHIIRHAGGNPQFDNPNGHPRKK
jgi:hypothetical protein